MRKASSPLYLLYAPMGTFYMKHALSHSMQGVLSFFSIKKDTCGISNGLSLYCAISILYKRTFCTLYNTGACLKTTTKKMHKSLILIINITIKNFKFCKCYFCKRQGQMKRHN